MVNTSKIWVRFLVVFLIHIIIKSFDFSFPNGPFALDIRSLLFTLFFVSYGLFIWYAAEWFHKRIQKLIKVKHNSGAKMLLASTLNGTFAFLLMVSLNFFYRQGDIVLFENTASWSNVPPLNPNLTLSLTIIYLIILGFDNYVRIQNKLQVRDLEATRLQKENITAQYKALKAQIEPHFLFNSLSVLSSLVYENADHAADFILRLSKTLRYIIEKNEFNYVKLSEELDFLNAYYFLIKTRLEDGVFLENKLEKTFIDETFIPPVTLQLLIENAISHNTYNPDNPLRIVILKEGDHIVVKNNRSPRAVLKESTKQGLKNVSKRYKLISDKEVEVLSSEQEFIVKLPVLNQQDHESFNI